MSTASSKTNADLHLHRQSLLGWACYPKIEGLVCRAERQSDLDQITKQTQTHTILARGAGRSYGDAAANPAGITVLLECLNRILGFDENSGLLHVEAGMLIKDLLNTFVPRGWMMPVVPGTKFVTVGGAIAADIHGKNHYLKGSFSRYVDSFELLTGNGKRLWCSRQNNSAAFWATVGGMGLTGIISEVKLSLARITSPYIQTRCIRAANLPELIESFAEQVLDHSYAVAWIDCLQPGAQFGRGILFFGDHTSSNESSLSDLARTSKRPVINIPIAIPNGLLNGHIMRVFNQLYFVLNKRAAKLMDFDQFFFPLDSIHHWNRLYGSDGFVQCQYLFPLENSLDNLQKILMHCAESKYKPLFVVLKQLGAAEPHKETSLSFPDAGYTVTIDFSRQSGLLEFIDELNNLVIQMHGRVYLAKDSCLTAKIFQKMYPQWRQWQTVRNELDPKRIFCSALSSRLGLID